MAALARTDTSIFGRWWWTVDRWTLAAVLALAGAGAILTLAASPAVAQRIGLDSFYFARRQMLFLPLSIVVMVGVSLMAPRGIQRLALGLLAVSGLATAATLFFGFEIKGATRWLLLNGMSVQPSEFLKPAFAVVAAWLFANRRLDDRFPGYALSTALFAVIAGLLLLQPDVGMTLVIAAVWAAEFFLAGLPMMAVLALGLLLLAGAVGAYFSFAHVQGRVDRFLGGTGAEDYQISQSLQAFRNGGLFGVGPGEGHVKSMLPDAHADFIFAVAGEEFGLFVCLALIALFAFVVLRGFFRALGENDLFVMLAVAGLTVQFGLQAAINLASTLHLIPPKGMTLPFISYGGSSALALAIAVGMILALTRARANTAAAAEDAEGKAP